MHKKLAPTALTILTLLTTTNPTLANTQNSETPYIQHLQQNNNPTTISNLWAKENDIAETILLTTDKTYADGLASGPLQGKENAPLFFIGNNIDETTAQTINRLQAKRAIILGGQKAIPDTTIKQLQTQTDIKTVYRITGKTRIQTAINIAKTVGTTDGHILIASSEHWADAITAGGLSATTGTPIILTPKNSITPIKTFIENNNIQKATIIGGTNTITQNVENQLQKIVPTVIRIAGQDRTETAEKIAKQYGNTQKLIIIDGYDPQAYYNGFSAALTAKKWAPQSYYQTNKPSANNLQAY